MATLNDVYKKFPEMKETIESMNRTVAVANKNPSPDEIIAGIKTIKTGYPVDNSTIVVENEQYVVKGIDNRDKLEDDPFKNNAIKARDLNDYAKETNRSISGINAEIENINNRDTDLNNKITLLSKTKATETQLGLVYFWKDDEGDWNISTINSYSSEDIPNTTGITLNVTARKVKTQVNATGTTLILG